MAGNSSNDNINEIPEIPHPALEEYNMNHKRRGKACIFHHTVYLKNFKPREGNDVDVERLTKELKQLDFDVEKYHNYTAMEILERLQSLAEEDHTDADCLVVAVLSHGDELKEGDKEDEEEEEVPDKKRRRKAFDMTSNHTILAFDEKYNEQDLFVPFNGEDCQTLRGKPKIFFIQACRGKEKQKRNPIKSFRCQTEGAAVNNNDFSLYWVPDTADFFIARATINGTVSVRDKQQGTLFIKTLCDFLQKNRERDYPDDLNTLLTFVNGKVAVTNIYNKPKREGQMPFVMHTLTKLVYLRPKSSVCEKMDVHEEDCNSG